MYLVLSIAEGVEINAVSCHKFTKMKNRNSKSVGVFTIPSEFLAGLDVPGIFCTFREVFSCLLFVMTYTIYIC